MNKSNLINTNSSLSRRSSICLYLNEISKYPLLDQEEEYKFAVLNYEHEDTAAAHKLVVSNLRLVVKIANTFNQNQINLLDIIQEGNNGLIQAVKRFDPYKGVKLSTYAAWWIKAYILKFIMNNKSNVKIATTAVQRKLFFKLNKESNKLLESDGKLDAKLLADNLNVKKSDIIDMQKRLSSSDIYLDSWVNEDNDNIGFYDISSKEKPADEVLDEFETHDIISKEIQTFKKSLKKRELEIFNKRILSENPVTLKKIGEEYSISRERIRQIQSNIIKKIKKQLNKNKSITN